MFEGDQGTDDVFNKTIVPFPMEPLIESDNPSDEILWGCISEFKNNGVSPPEKYALFLYKLLDKKRVEALVVSNYDLAEECDMISSKIQKALKEKEIISKNDEIMGELYQRYKLLTLKKKEIVKKYNTMVEEFKLDSAKKLDDIINKHKVEMEELREKWKNDDFLRQFNKPSTRLLQLREMEKSMAISKMYSKAKETKSIADQMQKEESQKAQQKIAAQMEKERSKLKLTHNKEILVHSEYEKKTIAKLQQEMERTLNPIENALLQLKAKRSPVKKLVSSNTNFDEKDATLFSPRTRTMYSQFRKQSLPSRLHVVPETPPISKKKTDSARSGLKTNLQ